MHWTEKVITQVQKIGYLFTAWTCATNPNSFPPKMVTCTNKQPHKTQHNTPKGHTPTHGKVMRSTRKVVTQVQKSG